ncbi:sensor domain-containing diguanylate cyclase [Idiomarina seosinensis]|uniref:GGDEF domain-containing protein n=1 Tax=Idiomarina seosinensis TaxID=281739 RepID=UPI000F87A15F|nr:sensor domain-containing diguanylate cyclase [Idiomarina seosinensis]
MNKLATDELDALISDIPAVVFRVAIGRPDLPSAITDDVERTLGYSKAEITDLEQWWFDHIHPNDVKLALKEFESWEQHEFNNVLRREYRFQHKKGHFLWVEDHIRRHSSSKQNVQFYVGIMTVIEKEVKARSHVNHLADVIPGVFFQMRFNNDRTVDFPYVSHQVNDLLGLSESQLKNDSLQLMQRVHPDDIRPLWRTLSESAKTLSPIICEFRIIDNEQLKWVSMRASAEQDSNSSVQWYGIFTDATMRKEIEEKVRQANKDLQLAQRVGRVGHWKASLETGELFWSDMIYELLGLAKSSTKPSVDLFNSLVHPDDIATIRASEEKAKETGVHHVQHRMKHAKGHYIWVEEQAEMQSDGVTLIGAVRDISEQKALELKLREMVATDEMTGLYNRRFFSEEVEKSLLHASRHKEPLSLLMLDIDHFKTVNDNYGHPAGDSVIKAISDTLQHETRSGDSVSRIGGEEFAIMLPKTPFEDAFRVAEKLRANIEQQSIKISTDTEIAVTITIGVAAAVNGDTWTKLLSRADKALYRGKGSGRNKVSD